MPQVLSRDEEAEGDLISWSEADELQPGDQISCAMNESAVVIDGDEVLAVYPAGIHALPAFDDAEDPAVAFVSMGPVKLETEGTLDDFEDADILLLSTVRVTDAAKLMSLLDRLDEDESLEDWLGDELLLHAAAAIDASEVQDVDGINAEPTNSLLLEQTLKRGNAVLAEYGVEVMMVGVLKVE